MASHLPPANGGRYFLDLGQPNNRPPIEEAAQRVQWAFWRAVLRYWPRDGDPQWQALWHMLFPHGPETWHYPKPRLRGIACEVELLPWLHGYFVRLPVGDPPHPWSMRLYVPSDEAGWAPGLPLALAERVSEYGTLWHARSDPDRPFPLELEPKERPWFAGWKDSRLWLGPAAGLLEWLQPTAEEQQLTHQRPTGQPAIGTADPTPEPSGAGFHPLPSGILPMSRRQPPSVRLAPISRNVPAQAHAPDLTVARPLVSERASDPSASLASQTSAAATPAFPDRLVQIALPGSSPGTALPTPSMQPYAPLSADWEPIREALAEQQTAAGKRYAELQDRLAVLRGWVDEPFAQQCSAPGVQDTWKRDQATIWGRQLLAKQAARVRLSQTGLLILPIGFNRTQVLDVLDQIRALLVEEFPAAEACLATWEDALRTVCGALGGHQWYAGSDGNERCARCHVPRAAVAAPPPVVPLPQRLPTLPAPKNGPDGNGPGAAESWML